MESMLNAVEKGVLSDKLGAVSSVAVSLAAACTAITLIGIGSKYLKGLQFDWWQFVRPLLIFLLVCNFSTLVLGPIRGIAGVYNTRLAAAVGTSTESFKAVFREKAEAMCHQEFGRDDDVESYEVKEDDNWFVRTAKKIGNKITRSFFNINESMNLGAATVISGILFFFMNLSVSVMIIIARLYLIVMALIGPFTFAISILTAYPGGIKLWVERYIQYTLWQPLLYMVMHIGTEIMVQGNQTATWGGFWAWCFMIVAIFTAIKQVPAFASFIIESAGTEALANQMSGIGGQVLQRASSAAMILR
jgi:hypothetical protein